MEGGHWWGGITQTSRIVNLATLLLQNDNYKMVFILLRLHDDDYTWTAWKGEKQGWGGGVNTATPGWSGDVCENPRRSTHLWFVINGARWRSRTHSWLNFENAISLYFNATEGVNEFLPFSSRTRHENVSLLIVVGIYEIVLSKTIVEKQSPFYTGCTV